MAYPANLAFAGLAAFLLALPLVTALGATVAAARSMGRWLREGDDAVFTATFREFAATWRRTLAPGVAAVAVVVMLSVDAVFLWRQLTGGTSPIALLLAAGTVPVAVAVALVLLALPVAAARAPDASAKAWLMEAGYLIARRPMRAAILLVITVAFALTCYLLPTAVPFFGLSVPVYLALVSLGGDQEDTDT
jgi:uncharacterized membrane protein YesL